MARYPEVIVDASGPGGNIFVLGGAARGGLRNIGVSNDDIEMFTEELQATQSYAQALAVVRSWVTIENDPANEVGFE